MLWHRQAIFESKGSKLSSSAESRIRTWNSQDTKSPADWMLADKPTELSRIKLKTWTRQPVPMISEHSAHLTPLSVDFRTCLWRYTYLLLLISMLWHRQAIFKSKGDKLCSSGEYRIWTRGPRHQITSRLNARWQTDWAIENQAKNLNSTARPYDQRAFSPLDHSVSWFSHLALAIYIFVVVNFDALVQASDIQIERRQVVFLCRMQDWNPGSQTPNRQQTECLLTNRLSYRKETSCVPLENTEFEPGVPDTKSRIKLNTWTRQPVPMISEHSAHLTPLSFDFRTWIWRYTYLLLLISMLWHRQAIFKSKGDKLCSSAECRIGTWGPRHQIASGQNARRQTDWAIKDQAKNLNSTARPYDQRAFSPLDPTVSWLSHLPLAIYIFVVVNFDALAQASDIQIDRRLIVFLCRMQDWNPGSQTPNRQQTECSLTNRLSYRGSS